MKEKIKNMFSQNALARLAALFGVIIVIIIIFVAGEAVGYHKAQFSGRLGDNYNKMFVGRKAGMMMYMRDNTQAMGHGASGTIVKVSLPQIVIENPSGIEQIITLDNMTLLKEFQENTASSTLKVGDEVIVLGHPGDAGEIKADLIRVVSSK